MLPLALRDRPQWLVSGEDKAPRSPKTDGKLADIRDPSLYVTYEEATGFAQQHGMDVGFVLTANDPFTVIDLDATSDEAQKSLHEHIYNTFESYAELSRSGNGVHIWCLGNVPSGARRDKVEVYSNARYMICTGRTIRDLPIVDYQELLEKLYEEMHGTEHLEIDLEEGESLLTDMEVFEMGMRAANSEKFDLLCQGKWQGDYPSQSEADFALLNILTFYTKNNEQVKRLFRMSALGKRGKAQREKYLDMMLRKIRAEAPQRIDFSKLLKPEVAYRVDGKEFTKSVETVPNPPAQVPTQQKKLPDSTTPQRDISYPPGFIGEIAQYIVDSSIRPVKEIGISAAIGLCAGILGRQFNVSGTGLNQYIIMLAKTGVGKEGGASGIERLLKACRPEAPVVDAFMGPGTFASGQAIIRSLDEKPSFVSVLGEFGLTLQELSSRQNNSLNRVMRRVLLDLYTKSGKSSILYSSAYSDKEKNTKTLFAPAMTLLGESTPETFYEGLNPQLIADGLVPRFLIIEYLGDRPNRNRNAFTEPPTELVKKFISLVEVALRMQTNNAWAEVGLDEQASIILRAFDSECDVHIRDGGPEGVREIWNRAHLKALRLAALVAVTDRPHVPMITAPEAQWAIDIVTKDTTLMCSKFEAGDIGDGDMRQIADVERVVREFMERPLKQLGSYGVTQSMKDANSIPYVYFQRRAGNLSSFRNDRKGAVPALRSTLDVLEKMGKLRKVMRAQSLEVFKTGAEVYQVVE